MANYPNTMPDLRAVENDPGVAYDPLQTNVVYADDINNMAAEILAIATELGATPKGTFADVAARLTDISGKVATYGGNISSLMSRVTALENKGYTRRIAMANKGVTERNTGSIANNTVAVIRNNAYTSDFFCSIPSTSKKLLLTIRLTAWTWVNGWWNISYIRTTTTGEVYPGAMESLMYLTNSVNTFSYEYEIEANSTTTGFKIRVQNATGVNTQLNYTNAQITVDEIG